MRSSRGKPAYGEGRQALIDATIRLVAREGLSRLTYRSLAAEAGITPGAFQHHFKSTDEVLDSALEYCIQQSHRYAGEVGSVVGFIEIVMRMTREKAEFVVFQVELFAAARLRPTLAALVARHQEAYRQIIRDLLGDLRVDYDEALVEFISAACDGIVFQIVMLGEEQWSRAHQQFEMLSRVIANYGALAATPETALAAAPQAAA